METSYSDRGVQTELKNQNQTNSQPNISGGGPSFRISSIDFWGWPFVASKAQKAWKTQLSAVRIER
jgi:hypothetical protein